MDSQFVSATDDKFSASWLWISVTVIGFLVALVTATNLLCGIDPRFPLTAPLAMVLPLGPVFAFAALSSRLGKKRIAAAFAVLGIGGFLGLTTYVMSYEIQAIRLPLADARLLAADRALGFDWDGYVAVIRANPLLDRLLVFSYVSMGYQTMLAPFLILALRPVHETYRHLAYCCIASALGMVVAIFFPAIGMLEWADTTGLAGAAFFETPHDIVMLMRERRTDLINLGSPVGMLTFPSFHALGACTAIYACRNTFLRIPSYFANVPIFFAAVFHGAHYLVDIFGGIGVFLAAVVLMAALERFFVSERRQKLRAGAPAGVLGLPLSA